MFFAKAFILLSFFNICASSKIVQSDNESRISNFIHDLISNYNAENSATQDVVVLRYSHFKKSRENVENLFSKIVQAIAFDYPTMTPPINQIVSDWNIRKANFIIMITDLYVPVGLAE